MFIIITNKIIRKDLPQAIYYGNSLKMFIELFVGALSSFHFNVFWKKFWYA